VSASIVIFYRLVPEQTNSIDAPSLTLREPNSDCQREIEVLFTTQLGAGAGLECP
jgi:hypothetical protein